MAKDPKIITRKSQAYVPTESDKEDEAHQKALEDLLNAPPINPKKSVTVTRIDDTEAEEMRKDAERR